MYQSFYQPQISGQSHFLLHASFLVSEEIALETFVKGEKVSSSGKIILDKKDGGLAPGQFIVFYGVEEEGDEDEMECLGAGVISEKHWASFLLEATESESVIT